MAEGGFELALRGLLGDGAPLSKSTVRRLRETWVAEHARWERRSLLDREIVYAWADGIYVKAGLEKDKAALLVVIGAMADGTKEVLAVAPGFRESAESWAAVLRGLKARGLGVPKLLAADGHLGGGSAGLARSGRAAALEPQDGQRARPPAEARAGDGKALLRAIAYAPSRARAEAARETFVDRCSETHPKAIEILCDDWDRLVAFYDFPEKHWTHLRTTNVVESPFASVRLRTSVAKRFKRVEGATALIWKLLMVAETRFRKLNASHLLTRRARGRTDTRGRQARSRRPAQRAA